MSAPVGSIVFEKTGYGPGQLADVCNQIWRCIGTAEYNAWAIPAFALGDFDLQAEAKLLEVYDVQARCEAW